ncbi:uroporphyrinogen-III synthase [Mesobacillus zeae]|uniref:Uroporphyrinogen-III synthase n=1 Tax=Mesobacillus zeae TaxID=1917180 RepID=A0A398B1Q0_9BACI|nr:uroporphyrinogen-III synthase [Mesobacillus zeae]RID83254.1 uroporphyrinogen-III synthase [Mesobacillus zeae]
MNPALPLQNKQVLIPRGKGHARSFSELVKKHGGIPAEIPLLAFRPVPASEEIHDMIDELHQYDWIIFTSNVTVDSFFSLYKGAGRFPKTAAIGEKTREALEHHGIHTDFMPEKYVAEEFVQEFLPRVTDGMKVLIPKGNLAREHIASSLRMNGASVEELIIYETYLPEESKERLAFMLDSRKLDVLAFTSPSTISHFMEVVKEKELEDCICGCVIACIGPVSKRKAEEHGLHVHVCPEKYTVEEMLKGIVKFLGISQKQEGKQ